MTTDKKKVLFMGAGRMAQAIIAGLAKKNEFGVLVSNSGDQERLHFVKETYDVEKLLIGHVRLIIHLCLRKRMSRN